MSEQNRFLRKCVGCGTLKPKSEMLRITSEYSTGKVAVNPDNEIIGRSCYICTDIECVNAAFKKMKISKFLKRNVNPDLREKIILYLTDGLC